MFIPELAEDPEMLILIIAHPLSPAMDKNNHPFETIENLKSMETEASEPPN